jgi:hypothetical protein
LAPCGFSLELGSASSNGRYAPAWEPIGCPFSQARTRLLTDSKRTIQVLCGPAAGSSKSLRYHATVPVMLAALWSVAFQAPGTVAVDQPAVEAEL